MVKPNLNAAGNQSNVDQDYNSRHQLALIPRRTITAAAATNVTCRSTGFKLPEGWEVEEVHRSSSSHVDKYYYEPGTGRKFRSLKAVERYVNGEEEKAAPAPLRLTWHNDQELPNSEKMIIFSGKMKLAESEPTNSMLNGDSSEYGDELDQSLMFGKMVRLTDEEKMSEIQLAVMASSKTAAKSPYNLPDGWVVEEVHRRSSSQTDKFFYEPGTGQKFRSLLAAQRHVAESNEDRPLSALVEEIKNMKKPQYKAFKLKKSGPTNKKSTIKKDKPSSNGSLPEKVEWVLAASDAQGDVWKPFVCDRAVPDSVTKEWRDTFISAMNLYSPNSTDCSTVLG